MKILHPWFRSSLHNAQTARPFPAAREAFLNCRKSCKNPTPDNYRSRISSKLQRNWLLRPMANLCWSML